MFGMWCRRAICHRLMDAQASNLCACSTLRSLKSFCVGTCCQDIKTADWSEAVKPFWGAVIKSALSTAGIAGLFKAGWTTIKV